MRNINELEARLILTLGNSFRNLRQLRWNLENHNKAYLEIEGKGNSYLLIVDHKGSGLIRLDDKPYFELDRYHTLIPIPFGNHKISLELSHYMDFGEKVDISAGIPFYTEIDSNAYKLYVYGSQILDLVRSINDNEVKDDLISALSKALHEAYFETISKEQLFILSKLIRTTLDVSRMVQEIEEPLDVYKEDENRSKFEGALNTLRSELSKLVNKYGKRGVLVGTGHAHIDTAWLWPFDETRRKVLRTFSTILTLLDKYDFHFIQSAAIYYEWVKADSPELFVRIKEKVKEGKWELAALYVESDANMVSGESLARQFLYSQRFYLENFGKLANILWLPDTFGFSASLPQIAKLGGVKAFATHKVFWNDTNKFPYNVFKWVGPNGDYLPAIAFGHGKGGYNSDFSASSVLEQYNNWAQKDQPMLYSYGYGDGGGGPNEDMLIRAEAVNLLPILPKVELSGVNSYIQRIVPVEEWRGELYLETHRGVLTSHSKMKLLNRSAEIALREAELWSTLARTYDKEVFTKLWKVVLKDQFHDVLPGSAIKDVYKVAYQELEEVINKANNVASEAMQKLVGGSGDKTFVFNSLSWDREEYIEADGKLVKVRVPSVGFSLLEPVEVRDKAVINENNAEYLVENKYFRVRISKSGQVLSLFDKEANREVLRDKSNLLIAYENIPGWADAWDIEKGFEDRSFEIRASSSEIVNNDGIVASIKFTYKFRRSEIIQIVRVYADSRRIDFITTLRMRDRELLVKSWFNFDLNVERAVSDIPFGVVERFTWSNTSWDKARFEVPIQKFVDFSESEYGAALLNNGKYGATLRGSSVGLSLTKTPIYPDPSTDLEEVTFIYSLYPHIGDWKRAEVIKRAYELNVPLRVVKGVSEVKRKSFIRINDSKLILEAVKVAEDDNNSVVLRLYEYENTRGEAYVEVPFNVTEARSLDLLELNEVPRDIVIEGNRIKVKYKNRDILTISVRG